MAVSIPQVVTEDRASGALVVDGSLRFDNDKTQYLTRTPTPGDTRVWTWSGWVKKSNATEQIAMFSAGPSGTSSNNNYYGFLWFNNDGKLYFHNWDGNPNTAQTDAYFRDTGWYHVVAVHDENEATAKMKFYVNGTLQSLTTNLTTSKAINNTEAHYIGVEPYDGGRKYYDGSMAQITFVDGEVLGPENFGYTDPLTNTWRPKKYTIEDKSFDTFDVYGLVSNSASAVQNIGSLTSLATGVKSFGTGNTAHNNITLDYGSIGTYTITATDYMASGAFPNVSISDNGTSWTQVSSGQDPFTFTGRYIQWARTSGSGYGDVSVIQPGLNSFYLPMDGNSPIGKDQSGRGNDWTSVNFGGSNTIEKATGALPILNTLGGTVARAGVFGSEVSKYYTTTSNTAAGSGYEFDQTSGFNPSLSFVRGATYTFDYTDSSSHPLRFSSTDPDSSVTSYTDGTNTSVSNTVKITVPHNAPDTLYYYCTSHNSMNGIISVTTDTKKADPYAWKNVLALPLVGSSSDVSNQINSGSTTKTITANGNAAASSDKSNFYDGSFEFDGTDDRLTLDIGAGGLGSGDFTIEFWSNSDTTSGQRGQFQLSPTSGGLQASATNALGVYQNGTGFYRMYVNDSGSADSTASNDSNKWNHFAVVRSGSTQKMYVNGIESLSASSSIDYTTARYLCIGGYYSTTYLWDGYIQDFRIYKGVAKYTSNFIPASSNPDILPDTPSGVGTKTQLTKITDGAVAFDGTGDYLQIAYNSDWDLSNSDFTIEAFINSIDTTTDYPSIIGRWKGAGEALWDVRPQSADANDNFFFIYNDGSSNITINSGAFVCDGGWHHLAVTRSGTNLYMFVDGDLKTTHNIGTATISNNTGVPLYIGYDPYGASYYNGFTSNVRLIKGTALYTSNFTPPSAPLTNVTNTKLLCCQSNTSATAAAVTPGSITANGDAVATNFNPFTTDINTVRGQEGAYATLNPLNLHNSNNSLSDGNLKFTSSGNDATLTESTIAMSSGKFYFEVVYSGNQGVGQLAGVRKPGARNYVDSYIYTGEGKKYTNGGSAANYGAGLVNGDVIGTAYDADNGTLEFFKNGVSQGTAFTGITGPRAFLVGSFTSTPVGIANFGQKPFKFPPPDGFQPLTSSTVRPDTVVPRPDQYVKATTYTGNGASSPGGSGGTQTINVGHKPDLIWIKDRTQAHNNNLIDSVNGAPNLLMSDLSNSLTTDSTDGLTAITDNGFTLGDNGEGTQSLEMNKNGNNYVAWTWKAGGGKVSGGGFFKDDVEYASAAAAGLTAGTITPDAASVGTKQGFSIIKYSLSGSSAQTIPHGLDGSLGLLITKATTTTNGWAVWHSGIGDTQGLVISGTDAAGSVTWWDQSNMTNNVFAHKAGTTSQSGAPVIAYCWHDVPGLQKFGTYTGNSSSNGPVIDLGFRPALILLKKIVSTDSNSGWHWYDNKRNTYNPANNFLLASAAYYENRAQNNTADVTTYTVDFLSNGFRLTHGSNNLNSSGATYIYAAWAEAPSFNLYGATSNAR